MNQNSLRATNNTGYIQIQSTELLFLENELSEVGSRSLAYAIDALIRIAVVAVFFAFARITNLFVAGWGFPFVVTLAIIGFGYHPVLEAATGGKTPGKHFVGIRVIKADGTRISVLDSFIRNILRLVDMFPFGYLLGMTIMFLERHNRRIGDIVADTLVIYDRRSRKSMAELVESRLLSSKPNPKLKITGVEQLTESERAIIKQLYTRIDGLGEEEKIRILTKLRERLQPRVRVEGTDDPELVLYKLYKRI